MGNIGEYLKRYRQRKEWSQDKMSKKLGMSPVTYLKIEAGYIDVNIKRLAKIAHILEVTVPDILFESGTSHKSFATCQFDQREKIMDLQNQLIEKEKELRWLRSKIESLLRMLDPGEI